MPNSQQGSQQNAGGAATGDVKDKAKQVAGQAQQAAGQAQEAARPYVDQAREQLGNAREAALSGYRQAEGTIARNPTPAILIGFGVGFGLGIVLTSLLTRKEETWSEKYLPDQLQNLPDQYSSLLSTLKGLPKTVQAQLPKGVSKYLS